MVSEGSRTNLQTPPLVVMATSIAVIPAVSAVSQGEPEISSLWEHLPSIRNEAVEPPVLEIDPNQEAINSSVDKELVATSVDSTETEILDDDKKEQIIDLEPQEGTKTVDGFEKECMEEGALKEQIIDLEPQEETKKVDSFETQGMEEGAIQEVEEGEQMQGIDAMVSNKIGDRKTHRQNEQYSSESSDYEDSSSDSSDDEFFANLHRSVPAAKLPVLKTKGELLYEDLPPVKDLHITVDAFEILKMGTVLHIMNTKERKEFLVVVQSYTDLNPLNDGSVLFLSADRPLGEVFEVSGPVTRPIYTIRFNSIEDIDKKGVFEGQAVYYSPSNNDLTHYVLVDELKQQKGSDASWKDNNEPPENEIDFSDDEQEKMAKKKKRAKNRRNEQNRNDEQDGATNRSSGENFREILVSHRQARRKTYQDRLQSPTPNTSHNYASSQNFPYSSPARDFFGKGQPRNAVSPRHFESTPSNNAFNNFGNFLQRDPPSPQSFAAYPHSPVASAQPFAPSNSASRPYFPEFPRSNAPSTQSFPSSNFQAPRPTLESVVTHLSGTFPQTSPNCASFRAADALHQNPPTQMAAPWNNVPLQHQILMQPQQPATTFFSRPPPNYNPNENERSYLQQNRPFTAPTFGAVPTAGFTRQNLMNTVSPFQFGTNTPQANSNIYPPRNMAPPSSNQHQGRFSGVVQSKTANPFMFPSGNNQPQDTQPIFGANTPQANLNNYPPRSMVPTSSNLHQGQYSGVVQSNTTNPFMFPSRNTQPQDSQPIFGFNQSARVSPCPVPPPFALSQTPPPYITNQQGLSSPHPPGLPSQTPPPTINPFSFPFPVIRDPMNHQNHPHF